MKIMHKNGTIGDGTIDDNDDLEIVFTPDETLTGDEITDDLIYAAFMDELTILCNNWGIEIMGCGCCGSPALEFTDRHIEHYTVNIDGENLEAVYAETPKVA